MLFSGKESVLDPTKQFFHQKYRLIISTIIKLVLENQNVFFFPKAHLYKMFPVLLGISSTDSQLFEVSLKILEPYKIFEFQVGKHLRGCMR